MILTFVDFELDEELYELRRGGEKVRLEPKAVSATNRERIVGC